MTHVPDLNDQWISLMSGTTFNYNRPEESDVTIEDIASALSNVCRFSGHLPRFYSVAQHLVNTSYIVPDVHTFTALMHDTAEAFTNDLPTPLKWALPVFKELEVKIEEAMSKKFNFEYPYPAAVKEADTNMLIIEKLYVKEDKSLWPQYEGIKVDHLLDKVQLESWQPRRAKREFLERYNELVGNVQRNKGVRHETEARDSEAERDCSRSRVSKVSTTDYVPEGC